MALQTSAQADVTSAFNANKQGDFAKASEYIDKALNDPKAVSREKTWRYRGDIYLNIVNSPDLQARYPNAVQLCTDSYAKSMELDTRKEYQTENSLGLNKLRLIVLDKAAKQYESNDYCGASVNFQNGRSVSEKLGVIDTISIFNGAYCADRCGKAEEAILGFQESIKIGYNIAESYGSIVVIYNKMGKKEDALKMLAQARQIYPKDATLLREEVNIYLADSNYTKAIDLLKALSIEDPKNEVIWLVLASTNEKLGNTAEVEACYLKAIEVNPNYYDALYNLGASYYNSGNDKAIECGKINYKEKVKFEECEKAANALYMKAVTQLELAYNVSPKNKEVIVALKMAYTSSGNFEGQKRMEEALKGL